MTTTYNITYNAQYDSHEVTFESKPATAVLDALKALKMRWNPKKACWYGFAKEHEIINAILENGEGETITGEKTEGATVYTDGYLGGGAVYGSKSNLHLYGADLSKAIREDIKRAGIKGVTVRCKSYSGGQSIGVTVALRPDEFVSLAEYVGKYEITPENTWIYTGNGEPIFVDYYFGQLSAQEQEETRIAAAEYDYERMTTRENRVNKFYIDEETHFTPETLAKIKTIQAIICAYRYDESNSQVDYFHTNFYYDIYTKPVVVKPTTPDDEPTKPAKEEPKEEPATEETAPVQPAEQAQENAKAPRYQVIVNDDRYGGLDEKLDYNRITDARKAMHGYVNEEDWESAAIYDRKSGEIVETYGEYFPVDQINVRTKAQESESVVETVVKSAEEPATIYKIDDNGHDIIVKCVGDDCYTVEYCEDGKRLGEVEENCTAEYIDFRYGILVNPEQNTQNQPEPTPEAEPAETITESAGVIPEEAPETAEPVPEPVAPSPIREDLARRAHEMMSYTDYREGSATAEYNALCDRARTLAEEQRKKVDPMYHDKIDALLAAYVRRMADNINRRNEIGTRCPSVLVAGPANFPVRKKQKQNAASDKNMEEYNEIQGILNKIRSVGTGGISGDDPNAREKIEKKIESLEALQNTMKAVNTYYRKHKTLDGCPDITPEQAHKIVADMERDWRSDPRPFEAYHLQNNNAEIHRLRERLAEMDAMSANPETGWAFDGGTVEICREDNRVRIFHDCKPDASTIAELKSHGFKWSPKAAAWQRQLTENAINAARRITT